MKINKFIALAIATGILFTLQSSVYADDAKPLYLKVIESNQSNAQKRFILKDDKLYKDETLNASKGWIIAGEEVTINKISEDVSYVKEYDSYIKNSSLSKDLQFEKKEGTLDIKSNANVYEKLDIKSKIIEKTKPGDKINYIEKLDNWYKIKKEDKILYLYYIDKKSDNENEVSISQSAIDEIITTESDIKQSESELSTSYNNSYNYNIELLGEATLTNSNVTRATLKSKSGKTVYIDYSIPEQKKLIELAMQYEGNRYIWGGNSLTNGIDCSGFTTQLYKQFGYGLPRHSGSQRHIGTPVSINDMQAGDIICFSGHVALYMGNGKMIHASSPTTGIIISNVGYGGHSILAVRRIF